MELDRETHLTRLSLDIAPVAQEIKMRTEDTIEKKKKGQKLKKDDLKKELDVVCLSFFAFIVIHNNRIVIITHNRFSV